MILKNKNHFTPLFAIMSKVGMYYYIIIVGNIINLERRIYYLLESY